MKGAMRTAAAFTVRSQLKAQAVVYRVALPTVCGDPQYGQLESLKPLSAPAIKSASLSMGLQHQYYLKLPRRFQVQPRWRTRSLVQETAPSCWSNLYQEVRMPLETPGELSKAYPLSPPGRESHHCRGGSISLQLTFFIFFFLQSFPPLP